MYNFCVIRYLLGCLILELFHLSHYLSYDPSMLINKPKYLPFVRPWSASSGSRCRSAVGWLGSSLWTVAMSPGMWWRSRSAPGTWSPPWSLKWRSGWRPAAFRRPTEIMDVFVLCACCRRLVQISILSIHVWLFVISWLPFPVCLSCLPFRFSFRYAW